MLRRASWFACLSLVLACGARTDVPGGEEEDASVADATPGDATVPDVGVDVKPPPPPPPPDDAQPPPPPPPPPDDAQPPPPPPPPDDAGTDAGPPECNITCTHNHQCEQQCPDIGPNDRWCCDEQVDTCYAYPGKHCPQTIFDAGFD